MSLFKKQTKENRSFLVSTAWLGLTLILSGSGYAELPEVKPTDPSAARKEALPQAAKMGRQLFRFDETVVQGRVQKPQAFYILQRTTVADDVRVPTKSFLERIAVPTTDPKF